MIQNDSSNDTKSLVSREIAESSDHINDYLLSSQQLSDSSPIQPSEYYLSVTPCKILDDPIPRFYDNIATNTYTVLQPDQSYYPPSRQGVTDAIRLYFDGWVSKIILDDFPTSGQYTLSINGQNQCTASLIEHHGIFKPVFDLATCIRSNLAKNTRNRCNAGVPEIIRDKCYNFNNVNRCMINISSGTEISKQHKITTEYFQINDDIITKKEQSHTIYPKDTHSILFHDPTYALVIRSDRKMEFLLMIENKIFGKFISDNYIYLKLDGSKNYRDKKNKYLSPEQQHSLNLSTIKNLCLIVLNDGDDQNDQNDQNNYPNKFHVEALSYITYNRNHIVRIFAH
jgi:hypothetical protein